MLSSHKSVASPASKVRDKKQEWTEKERERKEQMEKMKREITKARVFSPQFDVLSQSCRIPLSPKKPMATSFFRPPMAGDGTDDVDENLDETIYVEEASRIQINTVRMTPMRKRMEDSQSSFIPH